MSRDSQIMPECTMQCRSYEQVENPWPVTVWVLVTMLQICTKGHAALVKQDAHAWVAFPQAQESTKLHMMTSNSCSSANSASVMCCEHGMAAKYCCTVLHCTQCRLTPRAAPTMRLLSRSGYAITSRRSANCFLQIFDQDSAYPHKHVYTWR